MEFRLLGPLEVLDDGRPLALGGRKQRAVLAMLLLDVNEVVPVDRLVAGVWGESAAAGATATLQVYVSALRRLLEPVRGEHRVLVGRRPGYVLALDPDQVDVLRFGRSLAVARAHLADGRHEAASAAYADALGLWRGEPLQDFAFDDFAAAPARRLVEDRLAAEEERAEAELGSGQHAALVGHLEQLVEEHPLRERLWGHLMLAQYRSGRQADALSTYRRARAVLVDEHGVEPGPELRELERRVLAQDPGLAPPPGAARTPVKLPLLPDPVLGRESDLERVGSLLRRPDVPVVTLTGPGGTGKTTLAVAVANEVLPHVPGGVFFVPLADLGAPDQVLPAVAAVLEVTPSPDEPLAEALAVSLRGRATLLVLDNFEHVLAAAGAVADLCARVPALTVLVTSRSPLRIRGEHEHPVGGLALPAPGPRGPAEVLACASVQVLVARVRAVRPGFEVDDANAAGVAEICERLDGLPLALELAAARARTSDPAVLVTRLDRQLRLLSTGAADLPGRQRTMRAVIDWSHDLLTPAQQRLLAVLGATAGDLDAEMVAAALGVGADDDEVVDGLDALVASSLLRALPWSDGTRYRMQEPVREYAVERLAMLPDAARVRTSLLVHLVERLERVEPLLDGPDAPALLTRLDADHPAVRASLGWALDGGEVALAARLAVALSTYWYVSGRLVEGRDWLDRVLAAGAGTPRLLLSAGTFAYLLDDVGPAQHHLEQAAAGAREDGDDATLAVCLAYLGAVRLGAGDGGPAEELADQALRLATGCGSYEGLTVALSLSAVLAASHEDVDGERARYEQRLELARSRGDRRRIAETLSNLAELALATGEVALARTYAGDALDLARNTTRTVTRDVLLCTARVDVVDGSAAGACTGAREALRLSLELGQQFEVAQCLAVCAGAAALLDLPDVAARLYGCASRLRASAAPLDVELEPDVARQREQVHARLGPAAFAAAHAHGAATSLEDAVRLVQTLGEDAPSASGAPSATDAVAAVLQAADDEHDVARAQGRGL